MAISSPLQSKVPVGSSKTIRKLQTILLNRTKVKREIFQQKTILQNRRIENERRKQREDELEAPNLVTKPSGAAGLIAGSAKGFFERLVGFLSYLTAGWIINNLPTWISMGKEFIARTQQMGKILGNFIGNTTNIFKDFTRLLGAGLTNLMEFDFLDTSGRVSTAFDELNLSVENWGTDFENVIKLITTPLTEGIASGEDAPATGTQITDEGAYETTAPYSGSGGSTTTYSSTGGEIIKDLYDKDYGYYRPGARGSRGSARVHGADGQKRGHTGEDYAMPTGTALTMIAPGTVVAAVKGDRYNGGYGEFVVVQLDDGRYVKLAHLDSINVKKGDKVGAGTGPNGTAKVIGRSGETGLGNGPHLHLDVAKSYDRNSYMVSGTMDPKSFIDGGGLVKGGKVTATGVVTQTKPPASQPQQNLMGTPSSSGVKLGGGSNAEKVYKHLIGVGFTPQAAAGVIGNLMQETSGGTFNIDPQNRQKGGPGRGILQWGTGKGSGERWDALSAWAKKSGKDPWTLETQVEWMMKEMKDRGTINRLKGIKDTRKATLLFENEMEAAGTPMMENRYRYADKALVAFGGKSATNISTPSSPSPATTQSTPTPSPAQITPTGTPQNPQISQSLAPERTGPTVIVSQNPSSPPQQMMYSGGGGSSGGGSSPISDFALLNNFIKNKLLLDLAYL